MSGGALLLDFADCLTGLEQYRLAAQLLEEALPFYRGRGWLVTLTAALNVLSSLELRRGRFDRAAAAGTEAVQRATELNLARQLSWALATLAAVEAVLGRERECHAHSEEAIQRPESRSTGRSRRTLTTPSGASSLGPDVLRNRSPTSNESASLPEGLVVGLRTCSGGRI